MKRVFMIGAVMAAMLFTAQNAGAQTVVTQQDAQTMTTDELKKAAKAKAKEDKIIKAAEDAKKKVEKAEKALEKARKKAEKAQDDLKDAEKDMEKARKKAEEAAEAAARILSSRNN